MSAGASLASLRVSRPVNWLRYHLYRDVLLAYPRRRACNICGWRGRRFLTYTHEHVLCPRCGSLVRHRLIAAALVRSDAIRAIVKTHGASVLHFSPEYCLSLVFKPAAADYVRADYATTDCDIVCDISSMPDVGSMRFDVVIACDVLEHVPDDRAAMREIHRVLRPGGTAILTAPQFDGNEPTLEDPTVVSGRDRRERYGQEDHVRNYGADLVNRLRDAGFETHVIGSRDFAEEYVRRHVLVPRVPLAAAYGWNDRRIYFARRPPDS